MAERFYSEVDPLKVDEEWVTVYCGTEGDSSSLQEYRNESKR